MKLEKKENIWDIVKNKLKYDPKINPDIYNYYISKTYLYEKIEQNLIISVNNEMSKSIINSINNVIKEILKKETKETFNINYRYFPLEEKKEEVVKTQTTSSNSKKENFVFDNFVTGDSNNQAFAASKQVTELPGKLWNPLFLYGDSGLGKTHLLFSIKNKIEKDFKNYKVSYISSEEFGTLTIDKITKGYVEIEEFKNNFKNLDVLLIDDIQLLAKRTKTNELFFYILNYFIENEKQIVISSDKMPDELKNGFEKRLVSRFNSGLNIKINKPEYDTALKIIKLKLKNKNNYYNFSEEAIKYIAKNFSLDVRKLEGTINRMIFYSILQKKENGQKVEIADIEEAFKNDNFKKKDDFKITIKKIQNIICEEYNISLKILIGKSRISNIARARQLAMYFSRKFTDKKLFDISQDFNRKDHTSVISAIKKIEKENKNNNEFKIFMKKIEKKIKNS